MRVLWAAAPPRMDGLSDPVPPVVEQPWAGPIAFILIAALFIGIAYWWSGRK